MPLPEIPEWMKWSVRQGKWPYILVEIQNRTEGQCAGSALTDVASARDEAEVIQRVENAAARVYAEWAQKRDIDQIIERNWPHE